MQDRLKEEKDSLAGMEKAMDLSEKDVEERKALSKEVTDILASIAGKDEQVNVALFFLLCPDLTCM